MNKVSSMKVTTDLVYDCPISSQMIMEVGDEEFVKIFNLD